MYTKNERKKKTHLYALYLYEVHPLYILNDGVTIILYVCIISPLNVVCFKFVVVVVVVGWLVVWLGCVW